MPASRKEKDSTNHLEHRSINHPAGPKYLKDLALSSTGDAIREAGFTVLHVFEELGGTDTSGITRSNG